MKTPSAKRETLVLLAGLLWSIVGSSLVIAAMRWLREIDRGFIPAIFIGFIGGLIVYRFGFSKLAGINLVRIYSQSPLKDKVCVFAFQNRRSYFLVAIMMLTGHFLRQLPIDRLYLVPVYMTIGLGLFLSSLHYYRRLLGNTV
ncbi:MAG: hypothetical protein GY841_08225 [FCB group bacterium]|nr:hypothetical protein [FCB group bacterium]